ncbi:hypothetical protein PIB30_093791 [Stylosanthes scabra]|uniref:Uncharacterized protein n=1 Tax=Stylosanthes scabra TaxID=79078 RepID=A0ABU6SXL3_9FABA|nr:hypothetical protein [Stylosanthes scabra]
MKTKKTLSVKSRFQTFRVDSCTNNTKKESTLGRAESILPHTCVNISSSKPNPNCRFSPPSTPPSLHSPRRQKRGSGGGTGEEERNDSGERRRIRRKVPTSRKWRRRQRRSVIGKMGKECVADFGSGNKSRKP